MIADHRPIHLRQDIGGLWENFCILELIKQKEYDRRSGNLYFWRDYDQNEVDLVEFREGKYIAYEFKYNLKRTAKLPKAFSDTYPEHEFQVIHRENYTEYLVRK